MAGLTDYYENVLGIDASRIRYIEEDFVAVQIRSSKTVYVLAYGDPILIRGDVVGGTEIVIVGGRFNGAVALVKHGLPTMEKPIFKFSMVDVQQGDGMIVETPGGKIILIDGGDNQMFARHLAARYSGTTADTRLLVDAILVTHGDADHFEGLTEIRRSESLTAESGEPSRAQKRLHIRVDRFLHNGLVKRPGTFPDRSDRSDAEMFGATELNDGELFCTELVDDPRDVSDEEMNLPFRQWVGSLRHWAKHGAINASRVSQLQPDGIHELFEDEDLVSADVLGPIEEPVNGRPALRFLKAPQKSTELHLSEDPAVTRSDSASHTINGHSLFLRLHCGNVRFLLTGDLNQQAMARLRKAIPAPQFECEILKAPHHGSHDFDFAMLRQAAPVVSLISSGDESARKEHIHPRATLVSALGKVSRGDTGIVFMTELAAFFTARGDAVVVDQTKEKTKDFDPAKPFFSFQRTNFGIVHVRTDGKRVLAYTHSGKTGVNEGYAFSVDDRHQIEFEKGLRMRSVPA